MTKSTPAVINIVSRSDTTLFMSSSAALVQRLDMSPTPDRGNVIPPSAEGSNWFSALIRSADGQKDRGMIENPRVANRQHSTRSQQRLSRRSRCDSGGRCIDLKCLKKSVVKHSRYTRESGATNFELIRETVNAVDILVIANEISSDSNDYLRPNQSLRRNHRASPVEESVIRLLLLKPPGNVLNSFVGTTPHSKPSLDGDWRCLFF
jgi:hypothetical protein